jgi:hypothetical chaperone protein
MMMSVTPTLGIDFGTSNSAAGLLINGRPYLIEIEQGQKTLPTAVFFEAERGALRIGTAAQAALIQGEDGRYMRALKSVLGSPLMREKRVIGGETLTFIDIVARFLATMKARAESACFQTFEQVLSGRPVHFHSEDGERDNQALIDLTECYHQAGFKRVKFMLEPEAAALASGKLDGNSTGLIVDIGGGTSDFSIFRNKGKTVEIIVSHGVRVGGTDFDQSTSVRHVMPLLGMGTLIRREFGPGTLPGPVSLFHDLATWAKIPLLYTPETRRDVKTLTQLSVEPDKYSRLGKVIRDELGHEMAFAVEAGKIAANKSGDAKINLNLIERGG